MRKFEPQKIKLMSNPGSCIGRLGYTHAPLGSINSVGGVSTEINSFTVSPRSWLASFHFILAFCSGWTFVARRSGQRAAAAGLKEVLTAMMNLLYL
jgi:hypothetical protein